MKDHHNPDTAKKDKLAESYRSQAKAPRRGVKADDADEYQNKPIEGWNKSVSKHGAYREQYHAPQTRGERGPSQEDGPAIEKWDVSVEPHGQYKAQQHWDNHVDRACLGFKPSGEGYDYLGHFKGEEVLREGHNDGPNLNMDGVSDGIDSVSGNNSRVSAAGQAAEEFSKGMKTYEDEHGSGRLEGLREFIAGKKKGT